MVTVQGVWVNGHDVWVNGQGLCAQLALVEGDKYGGRAGAARREVRGEEVRAGWGRVGGGREVGSATRQWKGAFGGARWVAVAGGTEGRDGGLGAAGRRGKGAAVGDESRDKL
jgi:hypothetical protein